MRAVVFAYHDVGAQCLRVLQRHRVDIPLVVTHRDDPAENRWFERVADVADSLGVAWQAPDDPNAPAFVAQVAALAPDFIFSFYYRKMLSPALLACARSGALNMHGSLLPRYRGRAPVNWAVLHGETETGATLHYMAAKPDAGDIVGQRAVPIGPDETAREVFDKVSAAAAGLLDDVLPLLVAGTAPRLRNDIGAGSYFGGRKPSDGRIDWQASARSIHDLVRAVAPPYPGAFCDVDGRCVKVLRTRLLDECPRHAPSDRGLFSIGDTLYARAGDGRCLAVAEAECDGAPLTDAGLRALAPRPAAPA
ncbi:MAG: formyltransferase [Casimicrobiaceae bacterium]